MRLKSSLRPLSVLLSVACLAGIGHAAAPKTTQVTLEMRKDSGPYGKSAYSFRTASQDVKVHKNYVDVLYNKCGLIHVAMYGSSKSRICDLGAIKLADAPKDAPEGTKWLEDAITPVAGHVYLEKIADDDQKMTVAFIVDAVAPDSLKLTWVTLKPMEGKPMDPRHGDAGTHGQCGPHKEA